MVLRRTRSLEPRQECRGLVRRERAPSATGLADDFRRPPTIPGKAKGREAKAETSSTVCGCVAVKNARNGVGIRVTRLKGLFGAQEQPFCVGQSRWSWMKATSSPALMPESGACAISHSTMSAPSASGWSATRARASAYCPPVKASSAERSTGSGAKPWLSSRSSWVSLGVGRGRGSCAREGSAAATTGSSVSSLSEQFFGSGRR